jgi:hypothetical protein
MSTIKIDAEDILKKALEVVKAKLPEEIAKLNTRKGDALVLTDLDATAFYFAAMPDAAFNFQEFCVYGFNTNPALEGIQKDNNIKPLNLYFEIVCQDAGDSADLSYIFKLMRYSSALEQVFLNNSEKIMQGYGNLQVVQLEPSGLFSLDGKTIRSAGVGISARITAR